MPTYTVDGPEWFTSWWTEKHPRKPMIPAGAFKDHKHGSWADYDCVVAPSHYVGHGIEPIEFIRSHNFNFCLGNVIKYVTRAGKKDTSTYEQDLEKAIQYLKFELERVRKEPTD